MSASAIIFLDIDGVLQPPDQQDRFQHDMEELRINLTVRFDDDEYLELDRYDLAAVYYDWHKEAVERLRQLCIEFNAKIVISSDWRTYNPLSILRYYFRIHGLDRYLVGETVQNSKAPLYRAGEVRQYIEEHPEIERFVILDDRYGDNFQSIYPQNFVYTRSFLTEEDYQKAREILSNVLPHHEVIEIEGGSIYGKIISQLETKRILGGVGQRNHQTYVFPLNTPRGINVLQAQAFGDSHHNGIFVTHNNVRPVAERGIIHNTKEPEIEQLAQGIRLIYEMRWCDADDEPLFDEVRTIEFYEGKDGTYCDLTSQQIANYDTVEFVSHQHGAREPTSGMATIVEIIFGTIVIWMAAISSLKKRSLIWVPSASVSLCYKIRATRRRGSLVPGLSRVGLFNSILI